MYRFFILYVFFIGNCLFVRDLLCVKGGNGEFGLKYIIRSSDIERKLIENFKKKIKAEKNEYKEVRDELRGEYKDRLNGNKNELALFRRFWESWYNKIREEKIWQTIEIERKESFELSLYLHRQLRYISPLKEDVGATKEEYEVYSAELDVSINEILKKEEEGL